MNAPDQFDIRRSTSNLKADFETHPTLSALTDLESSLSLTHVHTHRLLAVNVFTRCNGRLKMLHMEVWWCRDLYRVHVFAGRNFLKGVVAPKHCFSANSLVIERGRKFVKMCFSRFQLIRKEISQRHYTSICVLCK